MKNRPNIYHRYLKLPFELEAPALFEEHGNIVRHQVLDKLRHPEVDTFLRQFGLVCVRKEAIYTPPFGKLPIHIDHHAYTEKVKINLSWGPEEGVVRWWESDIVEAHVIDGGTAHTRAYHHNLWAKEENATLIYEAHTNRPSLINVGLLHSTYNPTPHGRWTLCITPWLVQRRTMLGWEDAMRLLSDFIVHEQGP